MTDIFIISIFQKEHHLFNPDPTRFQGLKAGVDLWIKQSLKILKNLLFWPNQFSLSDQSSY